MKAIILSKYDQKVFEYFFYSKHKELTKSDMHE